MEELSLSLSRVMLGGNEELSGVVPHAGGGEGLYIAPRHTGLLYNTVDDTSKTLCRGTVNTPHTVPRYRVPTSCITGGAGSCTVTPTGEAQPRPVG